jgi:hypothetical protein
MAYSQQYGRTTAEGRLRHAKKYLARVLRIPHEKDPLQLIEAAIRRFERAGIGPALYPPQPEGYKGYMGKPKWLRPVSIKNRSTIPMMVSAAKRFEADGEFENATAMRELAAARVKS